MRGSTKIRWILLLMCCIAGCAQFRLPAIDPSGEQVFLPHPNYTTLNTPSSHFPKPAFKSPDPPPPCPIDPNAVTTKPRKHFNHKDLLHPGKSGQLFVSPSRLLAPVGGEVVLKSGIYGASGRPVANQPIEWMLSSDSVGTFVQVGDNGHKYLPSLLHEKSKKHSGTYAVSQTLKHPRKVTRGTANRVDDVHVERGQCWVSLSSATEGTSHITVVAPKAKTWDRRRRTVTVHWVDVAPVFPDHQVLQTGQVTTLRTTIARNNGQPLSEGWMVRYEVKEGDATFSGSKKADVTPGPEGIAAAQVSTAAKDASKSVIDVQVIRLGRTPSDPPQLVVSRALVNVTWSASALKVELTGPETAPIGRTVSYRIRLTNQGDLPARGVTLNHRLPPGMKYLNSNPEGQIFGDQVRWELGDIPSHSTRDIEVNCRSDLEGSVRNEVTAKSKTQEVSASATTRMFRQSLKLTMSGPDSAEVGEKVTFVVQVTNGSDSAMTKVLFKDHFDGGLVHSDLQESPVKFTLDSIAVGETVEKSLTFIVKEPGVRTHTIHVSTDEGQTASATGKFQVTAPVAYPIKSRLEVQKTGPRKAKVGNTVLYVIEIANTGKKPLQQIEVVDEYSEQLKPTNATDGFDPSAMEQRRISWYIASLPPGTKRQFQVRCKCVSVGRAENKVRVKSVSGLALEDSAITIVSVGDGAETVSGTLEPATGKWKIQVADLKDAIQVGGRTTYHIDLVNDRDTSDRDVRIEITLSEGLRYVGSNQTRLQVSSDKRTIQYGPIREVRAREKLPTLRIEAKGTKAGEQTITVNVTSRQTSEAQSEKETTTVYVE